MQYQKEEVRNRILCAAYGEFLKYGFYRTGMLQISNKAKVPIGNLYRYFKNKEALYEDIVGTAYAETNNVINSIFDKWMKIENKSAIFKDFAEEVAERLAELSKKHKDGITLLVENSEGSPYAGFKTKISDAVYKMLVSSGMFPVEANEEGSDIFLKIISANVTEGALTIITHCKEEEEVELFKKLLIYYFGNMDGRIYREATVLNEKIS